MDIGKLTKPASAEEAECNSCTLRDALGQARAEREELERGRVAIVRAFDDSALKRCDDRLCDLRRKEEILDAALAELRPTLKRLQAEALATELRDQLQEAGGDLSRLEQIGIEAAALVAKVRTRLNACRGLILPLSATRKEVPAELRAAAKEVKDLGEQTAARLDAAVASFPMSPAAALAAANAIAESRNRVSIGSAGIPR